MKSTNNSAAKAERTSHQAALKKLERVAPEWVEHFGKLRGAMAAAALKMTDQDRPLIPFNALTAAEDALRVTSAHDDYARGLLDGTSWLFIEVLETLLARPRPSESATTTVQQPAITH
jgi:hypothetical protein